MESNAQTEGSAPFVERESTAVPGLPDPATAVPSQTATQSPSPNTLPLEPTDAPAPTAVAAPSTEAPKTTPDAPAPAPAPVPAATTIADPNRPNELTRDQRPSKTIYDFQVLDCFHELYDLSQHRGQCVLIVNVASKSKDSTQTGYEMLQSLYQRHRNTGFTILAFPCNEFDNGEPDEADQIAELLSYAYPSLGDIEFPIMAKVDVNGGHELPLYSYLKSSIKGTIGQEAIRWNFCVFLVDKEGYPRYRFPPNPAAADVDKYLQILLDEDMSPAPLREETSCEELALQQTERSVDLNSTTDTIPGVDDSANMDEM